MPGTRARDAVRRDGVPGAKPPRRARLARDGRRPGVSTSVLPSEPAIRARAATERAARRSKRSTAARLAARAPLPVPRPWIWVRLLLSGSESADIGTPTPVAQHALATKRASDEARLARGDREVGKPSAP